MNIGRFFITFFCGKKHNGAAPWGYIVPLRAENYIRDALATVHFIYPEQVRMAKDALFSISEEQFTAMYNFKELKKKWAIRDKLAHKKKNNSIKIYCLISMLCGLSSTKWRRVMIVLFFILYKQTRKRMGNTIPNTSSFLFYSVIIVWINFGASA